MSIECINAHNGRSYKFLNYLFCNSFFLESDWPMENNELLIAFNPHHGRSFMALMP